MYVYTLIIILMIIVLIPIVMIIMMMLMMVRARKTAHSVASLDTLQRGVQWEGVAVDGGSIT